MKPINAYEISGKLKYLHPCEFAESKREFVLQDNIRGSQTVVTIPEGVATLDELISYRKYKRDYSHKPNDWDSLEPKAVWINGTIIENVKMIIMLHCNVIPLITTSTCNITNTQILNINFKFLAERDGVLKQIIPTIISQLLDKFFYNRN